jgi:hypothetical protein
MTDDIVAELDRWLVPPWQNVSAQHVDMVKRARDEIVGLHEQLRLVRFDHPRDIRAEALEEAAQICEEVSVYGTAEECVVRIRALKDKPS